MSTRWHDNHALTALVLALGLTAGGYLLGDALPRAKAADRMAERSVTMRGLAERNVTADLATWQIGFTAEGTDLAAVQAKIERDTRTIRQFVQAAGFPASTLSDGGGSISRNYDRDQKITIVTISRSLQFRTADVMRAQRLYAGQFNLIRDGVELTGGGSMSYSFTKLNEVKPGMIGDSIQDARRAAEQFAKDSGVSVGAIKSASQGYFSITARDGDPDMDGSGGGDTPFQKVRVVSTIDFYLS